jgi:hypothetical protein
MTSRRDRELKDALDAQRKAAPRTGDAAAVYRRLTGRTTEAAEPGVSVTAPVAESPGDRQSPPPETPLPPSETPGVTESPGVSVTPQRGFLRVPNAIMDGLLPQLDPDEAVIYLRLYRLAYGWGQETCAVSVPALGRATRLSDRTVQRVIGKLEARRLVKREGQVITDHGVSKGNVYRVLLPVGIPVSETPGARETPGVRQSPGVSVAPIKERREKTIERKAPPAPVPSQSAEEKEPRWLARTVAARTWEANKRDGYRRSEFRRDVRNALIGAGLVLDESTFEWVLEVFQSFEA